MIVGMTSLIDEVQLLRGGNPASFADRPPLFVPKQGGKGKNKNKHATDGALGEINSRDCSRSHFPYKLYRMLDDATRLGFEDVITWTSDGRAFQILDKEKFEIMIMPVYFSSCRFKTFQRSLNLWSFRAENEKGRQAPPSSRRCHPLFQRGLPELCHSMTRTRVKEPGARSIKKKSYRGVTVSTTIPPESLLFPNPTTKSNFAPSSHLAQIPHQVNTTFDKAPGRPSIDSLLLVGASICTGTMRNQQERISAPSNRATTSCTRSLLLPSIASSNPFSPVGGAFSGSILTNIRLPHLLHRDLAWKQQHLQAALRTLQVTTILSMLPGSITGSHSGAIDVTNGTSVVRSK